jgi:hypothetical protein
MQKVIPKALLPLAKVETPIDRDYASENTVGAYMTGPINRKALTQQGPGDWI